MTPGKAVSVVAVALALILAVILGVTAPALAWHRGGAHIAIGVGPFWWGPYPYWPYDPPYPPYPYVYPPPPVIVQEPPVYVQQVPPPAPSPSLPPPPEIYWYYCASARAYYPSVPQCPEAWIKVPPRPLQ